MTDKELFITLFLGIIIGASAAGWALHGSQHPRTFSNSTLGVKVIRHKGDSSVTIRYWKLDVTELTLHRNMTEYNFQPR